MSRKEARALSGAPGFFRLNSDLNNGNLGFNYVEGDGLYYTVQVGADSVSKKLGDETAETFVSEWAAGITGGSRAWDEAAKIPSGHKIIGIRNFSASISDNGNGQTQIASGGSFAISGSTVTVKWAVSQTYINAGWSGYLVTMPDT